MSSKVEKLRTIVTKIGRRSGPGGTVYSVDLIDHKQSRWTEAFVLTLVVWLVWIYVWNLQALAKDQQRPE